MLGIHYFSLLFIVDCYPYHFDYCSERVACGPGMPHTVCVYPFCKAVASEVKHDRTWRERSLYHHNKFRNRLASGQESLGGNSAASNMRALSYDMSLEFVVGCWLLVRDAMEHDKCRGTEKFPDAGQNLWEGMGRIGGPNDPRGEIGIEHYIWAWYRELNDTKAEYIERLPDFEDIKATHPNGKEVHIGHFTQLCWAEVTHVGCARVKETGGWYLVGCNYGPTGNWVGRQIYKRGPGASDCPAGLSANKDFPALCGEIEPMPPDSDYIGMPELDERLKSLTTPSSGGGGGGGGGGKGGSGGSTKRSGTVKLKPSCMLLSVNTLILLLYVIVTFVQ